jgi:hypothetical protein
VNQEICPRHQAGKRISVLLEVKRNPPFVGIESEKEPALLRVNGSPRKWPTLAGTVAAGFLHFDHLGAKVGHQLCGVGRRHHVPQFQDLHTV